MRESESQLRRDWLPLLQLAVWAINLTLRYLLYNCSVNVPTWALGRQSCPGPKLAAWWPRPSHSSTRGLMAQMAQVIPFPPRTDNSPQRPNSMLPPTLKEADQGQQQTGQFKLECLSLQKLLAPSGAAPRTPSCQLCFCTNLCRPQHALQRWASIFSPCFANKVTVVQKWKTEWAKKNLDFPTPVLSCLRWHCFWQFTLTTSLAVRGLDEEPVPDRAVTSSAL